MISILLDENIDGYADYLARFLFAAEWSAISTGLNVRIVTFDGIGLAKGSPDELVWEICQQHQYYLLTDNRNKDKPDSLEAMIRTRNLATSVPVFTISDIQRLRTDRNYVEALVAKLLEYLMDADNMRGTGRLYLP